MAETSLFQGISYRTTDDKGRIVLPVRFRDALIGAGGKQAIITIDGNFLAAYTPIEWQRIVKRTMAKPKTPEVREIIRHFIGPAEKCDFDKQGRIRLPASLRKVAGIKTKADITLVGGLTFFELWASHRFEAAQEGFESGKRSGRYDAVMADITSDVESEATDSDS